MASGLGRAGRGAMGGIQTVHLLPMPSIAIVLRLAGQPRQGLDKTAGNDRQSTIIDDPSRALANLGIDQESDALRQKCPRSGSTGRRSGTGSTLRATHLERRPLPCHRTTSSICAIAVRHAVLAARFRRPSCPRSSLLSSAVFIVVQVQSYNDHMHSYGQMFAHLEQLREHNRLPIGQFASCRCRMMRLTAHRLTFVPVVALALSASRTSLNSQAIASLNEACSLGKDSVRWFFAFQCGKMHSESCSCRHDGILRLARRCRLRR